VKKFLLRVLAAGSAAVGVSALAPFSAPSASAEPCPDVEVVFARGTGESPGVGWVGQPFVDALRNQLGGRSVDVYPVNYQASGDFGNPVAFAQTVIDGISDAGGHIRATAANCPNTKIVLGGFSQGAAVAGYTTQAAAPAGVPLPVPDPLPADVATHVAAVALFGTPSDAFLTQFGAPPIVVGPLFAPKTIEQCAPGDTVCDGAPFGGGPTAAHALYPLNGMVGEAAAFTASRI